MRLRRLLKVCLDATLYRSPLQLTYQIRASNRLTVLAYHGIDNAKRFEKQIDYLVDAKHPVSLTQVLDCVMGKGSLPGRSVLVTFDDGDRSVFEIAVPILSERGIPAVLFVVAGLLDTESPPWWVEVKELVSNGGTASGFPNLSPKDMVRALKRVDDDRRISAISELRETTTDTITPIPQLCSKELPMMASEGIAIGSHTLTHPILPNCPGDKIFVELRNAHKILTNALGHPPRTFAYPDGAVDKRAVRALKEMGYEAAFLFDHRLSPLPPPDPLRISRVRVNSHTSLNRFKIILSGLHPAIHHLMGRK